MFHKRLNETRKNAGITAQQMADWLGIELRSYRNYESGDREQIGRASCRERVSA